MTRWKGLSSVDVIVAGYRDQLVSLAQKRQWDVREESATDSLDARLIIRQGAMQCPVMLYHTGKILVQGKKSSLYEALDAVCRQLEAGDAFTGASTPSDVDQAIQSLVNISQHVPSLDPMVVQLASEAVLTYQNGTCLATAFLLGAASERLILQLIDAFAFTLTDDARAVYHKRIQKERSLTKRWETFRQAWIESPLRIQAAYDLDAEITQTFHFTRICRNEAGHLVMPPRFDCDLLRANLAYFRRYLAAVQGLIDLCHPSASV